MEVEKETLNAINSVVIKNRKLNTEKLTFSAFSESEGHISIMSKSDALINMLNILEKFNVKTIKIDYEKK